LTAWYSYRRIQDADARIKIVTERSTQRIVGATMLSSEAEQVINYLDFVIQNQLTPTDIEQAILAYPTLASDLTYFG
ncbi:MAG: NAD(P)/FAD-dependent oxidoreductase, partial [Levilactobacillus brevis]